MQDQFQLFHTFSDAGLVNDFTEKLEKNGISFKVEKVPRFLDSTIIGTSSDADFVIKLKSDDFIRAHQCLEDYYRSQIENIDKDYYLFSFTNDELFEIISKPDEWGYLDYQLAQKILFDRGEKIDNSVLQKLKSERKDELAKPEQPGFFLYFVAYLFLLTGLLSFISPVFIYSDFTYLFTLISFFIGKNINTSKKTLPDGQSVFYFPPKDRQHGKTLMSLALVIFVCGIIKHLILSFIINNN